MATAHQQAHTEYNDFVDAFDTAIRRAGKSTAGISIALVDIDWFGKVNADFGRPSGDAIIARLAEVLGEKAGDHAKVYRYGGDAYMVMFTNLEKEQAFLRIEEARKAFDTVHTITAGKTPHTVDVTISCGVAAFPDDGSKSQDLIRKCSEALYRAKISGRNKVALAREEKMVTKTTHYTTGQLDGLQRLAKREGLNEATLLREALDDILRKYNK